MAESSAFRAAWFYGAKGDSRHCVSSDNQHGLFGGGTAAAGDFRGQGGRSVQILSLNRVVGALTYWRDGLAAKCALNGQRSKNKTLLRRPCSAFASAQKTGSRSELRHGRLLMALLRHLATR